MGEVIVVGVEILIEYNQRLVVPIQGIQLWLDLIFSGLY